MPPTHTKGRDTRKEPQPVGPETFEVDGRVFQYKGRHIYTDEELHPDWFRVSYVVHPDGTEDYEKWLEYTRVLQDFTVTTGQVTVHVRYFTSVEDADETDIRFKARRWYCCVLRAGEWAAYPQGEVSDAVNANLLEYMEQFVRRDISLEEAREQVAEWKRIEYEKALDFRRAVKELREWGCI